jgi:hypothetical protein
MAIFTWSSSSIRQLIGSVRLRASTDSDVERHVETLLARMRNRQYSETIPVLATYWLKTIWASGHELRWWKKLHHALTRALYEKPLDVPSRQGIADIQDWVEQTILRSGQTPSFPRQASESAEITLDSDCLAPYIGRLLNEWMPAEVARLSIAASERFPALEGMPALTIARAIENLLVRTRLSKSTLEMLLQPELMSPRYIYPADAEILRDVVLWLLGETESPPPPCLPATLLWVAPDSPLSADYRTAVPRASLVQGSLGEELHVPVGPAQALGILNRKHVRIGSVVVTMDGRCWESKSLQEGQNYSVIHLPMGRLRIDCSQDHAKLTAPWPQARRRWPGAVSFPSTFEIFGRKWRVSGWRQDAEHAWLELVYARALTASEIAPAAGELRRLRPASADMAWSALETALTCSMEQKSQDPLERLRHSDLIPLGRALLSLVEAVEAHRRQKDESIGPKLHSVAYFAAQLPSEYGAVPWRIIPAATRAVLLRQYGRELSPAFDVFPVDLRETANQTSVRGSSAMLPSPAA